MIRFMKTSPAVQLVALCMTPETLDGSFIRIDTRTWAFEGNNSRAINAATSANAGGTYPRTITAQGAGFGTPTE